MERPKHRRSSSLFGSGGTFSFGGTQAPQVANANAKTYGKRKNKPTHKSVLTQSHIDQKLWAQPEANLEPIPHHYNNQSNGRSNNKHYSSKSVVGLGVLDFESNKENQNSWEDETTQVLKQVVTPQKARPGITPSDSSNSLSSAKGALSKMARALSSMSTSSISSKSTVEPSDRDNKHVSVASTVSTIGKGASAYTAVSVGGASSQRESTGTVHEYNETVQQAISSPRQEEDTLQSRRANSSPNLLVIDTDLDYEQKTAVPRCDNEYTLETPPKMPVAAESLNTLSHKGSSPALTPSTASSLKSRDSRMNLTSSPSAASFLSFKKEGNEIQHKVINKTNISGPSGLVDTTEYFDNKEAPPVVPRRKRRSGHKNGSSIFSSISSTSLFSLAGNTNNHNSSTDSPQQQQKQTRHGSVSSGVDSIKSKKSSLSGVKRSLLSKSSSLFRSTPKKQQDNKPMISLPTPSDSSREKLQNKLRASNSLLSLARSDTSGSLVAVPAKEYQKSCLESLQALCNSTHIMNIDTYADQIPDHLTKLAEASFSEVYIQDDGKSNSLIYKVIPFGNEQLEQLPVQDIIQELSIARLLMSMDGYVDVIDAAVVRGRYPKRLLNLWDDYAEHNNSESHRPDFFQPDQLYCIMVLSNAGTDLEHFELSSWAEAENIFWQTVKCLARAEERFKFEHRDLHWGNLVISTGKPARDLNEMLEDLDLEANNEMDEDDDYLNNLKVTLIDYTLSRATNEDGHVIYTRMDHPDFFRGKGDYQFDIYRFMRNQVSSMQSHTPMASPNPSDSNSPYLAAPIPHSGSTTSFQSQRDCDWSTFCPKTNIMWLHYIADKLLNAKGLQRVVTTRSGRLSAGGGSSESLRDTFKRGQSVNDEAKACKSLETIHSTIDPRKKRFAQGNKKGQPSCFQDFNSAQHVLMWGQRMNLIPKNLV